MKFVPTELTCTLWRVISLAAFLASMVAPARIDEYRPAPGVGLAAVALVMISTCPDFCCVMTGNTAFKKLYGGTMHPLYNLSRSSRVELTMDPVMTRPENMTAESIRPNCSSAVSVNFWLCSSFNSRTPETPTARTPRALSSSMRPSAGSPISRSNPFEASCRARGGPT